MTLYIKPGNSKGNAIKHHPTFVKNRTMFRIIIPAVCIACNLAACTSGEEKETTTTDTDASATTVAEHLPSITGTWVEPIPGNETGEQGIQLMEDGTATSVNMATLQYSGWKIINDSILLLTGKSIGNRQVIDFTDTFRIAAVSDSALILDLGTGIITYKRK